MGVSFKIALMANLLNEIIRLKQRVKFNCMSAIACFIHAYINSTGKVLIEQRNLGVNRQGIVIQYSSEVTSHLMATYTLTT